MSIYDLAELLDQYGKELLVLDFNRLFVSTTLREELWLLQQRDDQALLHRVVGEAAEFGIRGTEPDRSLSTYSGGEQAILACLLMLATIDAKNATNVKLLLYNVLDSLSPANRARLEGHWTRSRDKHGTRVFWNQNGQVVEAGP